VEVGSVGGRMLRGGSIAEEPDVEGKGGGAWGGVVGEDSGGVEAWSGGRLRLGRGGGERGRLLDCPIVRLSTVGVVGADVGVSEMGMELVLAGSDIEN